MADVKWENNIFGLVPREEWINTGFTVTRPNDPIDGLFGDEKTNNIVASWQTIADEYQLSTMAEFHGFDTQTRTTFRIPVDTHNIEKGLIKVKINQSERMRALMRAGVQNAEMLDYVIRDGVRLADQVVTRTKVAKNELLATGKVTIKENNLDLTVDYGVPSEQTGYTFKVSDDDDIPAQFQQIIDDALEKGVTITGMVTSRKMLSKIRSSQSIQKAINGYLGAGAIVSTGAFNDFMSSEYGINTIITNDTNYGIENGIGADGRPNIEKKRYYPENKITFFSPNQGGRLGVGLWGDPPEVDIISPGETATSSESQYVYIMQYNETDPAVLWTKASALFIPVLYNPSSIWIATLAEDSKTIQTFDSGSTILNKNVGDMVENLKIYSTGEVEGDFKYIEKFTDFSTIPEEQSGHYLPFKINTTGSKMTLTFTKNGIRKKPKTIAFDPDVVARVENTSDILEVDVDGKNYATLTFKNAKLDPEPVKPKAKV